jgi:RsfA family transcription factor
MSNSKWTKEEENLLTEMVKSYLHKKKTKKEAFDVVANILDRSSSACRARYLKIEKVKVLENETKQIPVTPTNNDQSITFEEVISFLKKYKTEDHYIQKNHKLRSFLESLKKENEELNRRYHLAFNKIKQTKDLFMKSSFVHTYNE